MDESLQDGLKQSLGKINTAHHCKNGISLSDARPLDLSIERPFICKECGNSFKWQKHLTVHLSLSATVLRFAVVMATSPEVAAQAADDPAQGKQPSYVRI